LQQFFEQENLAFSHGLFALTKPVKKRNLKLLVIVLFHNKTIEKGE